MRSITRIGIPLAAIAFALSACTSGTTAPETDKPANKPADKPTIGATIAPADFANRVGKAMKSVKTFQTETSGEIAISGNNQSIKSTMLLDQSDPTRLKIRYTVAGTEAIVIGDDFYFRANDQEKYKKTSLADINLPGLYVDIYKDPVSYYNKIFAGNTTITYQGEEKIAGKTAYRYTVNRQDDGTPTFDARFATPHTIYLDAHDRVVQTKTNLTTAAFRINVEANSSKFDEKVSIDAPPADQVS